VPASHFIALIENEPAETERLARQLVRLGIEPLRVADLAEAMDLVKSRAYTIGAVLLPGDLPPALVRKALRSMRRREPMLPAMAYGKRPGSRQLEGLRRADVLLALWEGYDEGALRFQMNRMLSGETQQTVREARRAPWHEPVRISVGGREKPGTLYSLSERGCFIETPRASMDGARLRLAFDLEGEPVEIDGIVVFANVPGNLQRPNLPLGMGIRFGEMPRALVRRIGERVRERITLLEV